MGRILFLLIFIMFSLSKANELASDVYKKYYSEIINGITFENEKKYYSNAKVQDIEKSFPRYMKQMKKTKAEVIEFYQKFSQEVAKCKKIKLVNERILSNFTILEYYQTDTCGNISNRIEKQIIRMVYENGWKIDSIEVEL